MKVRRSLILALALAVLLVMPLAAKAQPAGKVWRIGYLSPLAASADSIHRQAFSQGLRELGYVEGQNLAVERIDLNGPINDYGDAMKELIRRRVHVIIARWDTSRASRGPGAMSQASISNKSNSG